MQKNTRILILVLVIIIVGAYLFLFPLEKFIIEQNLSTDREDIKKTQDQEEEKDDSNDNIQEEQCSNDDDCMPYSGCSEICKNRIWAENNPNPSGKLCPPMVEYNCECVNNKCQPQS